MAAATAKPDISNLAIIAIEMIIETAEAVENARSKITETEMIATVIGTETGVNAGTTTRKAPMDQTTAPKCHRMTPRWMKTRRPSIFQKSI